MPNNKYKKVLTLELFSIDSGNKCKNAPPKSVPVERATSKDETFANNLSFKINQGLPINLFKKQYFPTLNFPTHLSNLVQSNNTKNQNDEQHSNLKYSA